MSRRNADIPDIAGLPPPNNTDAEGAVLSAIILERDALDRVLEILKPEHFYSDANRRIYEAAVDLAATGQPLDSVSVAAWLRSRDLLQRIGGTAYLAQVVDMTPAVAHVGAHARVVFELWRLRELIRSCQTIAANGYVDVPDVQGYIDAAEQQIFQIAHDPAASTTRPELIGTINRRVFTQVSEAAARGERLTGTPTGYAALDKMMAGLHDGDLTIIAARPGMGKSSIAMNIAVNVAAPRDVRVDGHPMAHVSNLGVCVFSLEMPREQLAGRIACSEARIDLGRFRECNLSDNDWGKLAEVSQFVHGLPLWIDDTPAITLLELRAKVRRIQAEFNKPTGDGLPERRVGLIVVDYLQLMRGRDGATSREQEIAEISRGLKQLAKELRVPVIALSQLNRAVETRNSKDKRPQLSDLRESGSLEQDADNIVFIYRDEYYNPETTNEKGIAQLIIAKQRSGPTGMVLVKFTSSCTKFEDLPLSEYPKHD